MTATFPAPSPGRLLAVELRKTVDTRAGRALLAIIELAAAVVVGAAVVLGGEVPRDLASLFVFTLLPVGVLLPVLGILSVTSEWSQRSALTTFTLVPTRGRVLAAKFGAAAVLAVASLSASLATAATGELASALLGNETSWNLTWSHLGQAAVFQLINVLMGVAFGALLLDSALAIVTYFLIPTAWTVLGSVIAGLREPAGWLDLAVTMEPLVEGPMTAGAWARLATSTALWVAVPLAIGVVRVRSSDIS